MKNKSVKQVTFVAMYTALAVILELLSRVIPSLPQGGSIELGLIPVFIASYHLGFSKGLLVGALWWLVGLITGGNNYYLTFLQYCFDYIIPFCICGIASLFPRIKKISNLYTGIVGTMILKYFSHVLSGVFFFAEYGPEGSATGNAIAWGYSLSYNLSYNLVTMIICLIVVPILVNRLSKNGEKFIGVK